MAEKYRVGYADGSGNEYVVEVATECPVATVRWGCSCCKDTDPLTAEEEARIRLMAAAPSLYDALNAFLSITSYCGREHCTSVSCVAAHNALKALAAARGES